jgi:hypothetical protein
MMNLVDASVLHQVVATTGTQAQPAPGPPPTVYQPQPPVAAPNMDAQRVYSLSQF